MLKKEITYRSANKRLVKVGGLQKIKYNCVNERECRNVCRIVDQLFFLQMGIFGVTLLVYVRDKSDMQADLELH